MTAKPQKSTLEPLPTEAELEILQVLWSNGEQTVREVHEALSSKQTGYTTFLKQMQMMVSKGLLIRNEFHRSHVYSAKRPQESTQHRLLANLVQRAFSGSAKNLVLGALAANPVSPMELAEIKAAIREFEEKAL